MLKRVLATATLIVAVPAFAHAWTVNTWAKNGGGNIVVDTNPAQTVTAGSVFKNYANTTLSAGVVVNANTGYTIKAVTVDGAVVPSAGGAPTYSATLDNTKNHTVYATFKPNPLNVTVSAGANGSITPTTVPFVFYNQVVKQKLKFTVTPKLGYKVATVTATAGGVADTGVTIVPATADGKAAYVYIPAEYKFTKDLTIGATFAANAAATPTAIAGNAQTIVIPKYMNYPVVLDGTASVNVTGTSAVWSVLKAPTGANVVLTQNAGGVTGKGTFLANSLPVGTYVFMLAINGATYDPTVIDARIAKTTVTITDSAKDTVKTLCVDCHAQNSVGGGYVDGGVFKNWSGSIHGEHKILCSSCHSGANTGAHPGVVQCTSCHSKAPSLADVTATTVQAGKNVLANTCAHCHATVDPSNHTLDIHNAKVVTKTGCVDCHDVQIAQHGNLVNDNSGVRAVVPEFTKRSHHILNAGGAAPTNAQCVVCHMEGTGTAGVISVDANYHMKDAKIYLRDVDHAGVAFAWDGTNHSVMDNFCFACHDNDGAADTTTLQAILPAATASNPFADSLTNGYDQVQRSGVVDVKTAFTVTNASHHAVSGQRYKYRFSTVANATAWVAEDPAHRTMPAASEIAEGHTGDTLNGNALGFVDETGLTYEPEGAEEGGEATLYEAGKFVSTYTPLGASQTVGDNSTLHCGDCHTVGQWKPGSSTNADGSATSVAIGAHGSNNEYLLRNSLGTDALHNGLTYVCFNCHKAGVEAATNAFWAEKVAEKMIADSVAPAIGPDNPLGLYIPTPVPNWKAGWNALHPMVFAGQLTGYATAHAVSAMHAQCLADSADNIGGTARLLNSWQPQSVKAYDYTGAPGATAALPAASTSTAWTGSASGSDNGSGNLTGIACTNCHNSGLRTSWGGIHGGDNTYTDGLGRTQKTYRFMPGMGNYRYAPPGGWDGKDTSDATLLTQHNPLYPGTPGSRNDQGVGYPGPNGKPMGGCYTGTGTVGSDQSTYSACNHHGTSTANSVTTLATKPANFRTTYGGGTTGNPTTYEPTVREATAGGTLVTRPLFY